MTVTYKAGSLMAVPDALSRLKARLETETTDTLIEQEDETTNVFALTFVELEDDLSRSSSEVILLDPRMEKIC